MNDSNKVDLLLDVIAEAMVLVDPEEPETVEELAGRLRELSDLIGADANHPVHATIEAVGRLGSDPDALSGLYQGFSAIRDSLLRARRPKAHERIQVSPTPPPKPEQKAAPTKKKRAAANTTPKPGSAQMPLAGDEELLRDFALRSFEHLDDADGLVLVLESDPGDRETVDSVFRAFHTIKGMAGFLALDEISERCHTTESVLSEARATGAPLTEAAVQELLNGIDALRKMIGATVGVEVAALSATEDAAGTEGPAMSGSAAKASVTSGTVRVEEARLDTLLDTIGEMVIAESMVSSSLRTGADVAVVLAHVERLDKISRELQQLATSLRMVTLAPTFRRMARLVRDVAAKAGKQVEFVILGEDTELDKVVVDRIGDPLVHALRNAVDHGIESPKQRKAAGKPEVGRVTLRAFHAGGSIHIEVSDDGRGIDLERVAARARELGLIAEDRSVDSRTALDLLYSPGFSTAEKVTDVSGRGVGMDVVKRTIDELRGRIDMSSSPGAGTTFDIRLPITLAIIDGLTIRVGHERYIVPLMSIERSVRPREDQIETVAGRGEMLVDDEGLVPIIRLHKVFSSPDAEQDPTKAVVVVVDDNGSRAGLLACELLDQQQTVIKPLGEGLPDQPGISGGAVMSDGTVGLIIDAASLIRSINSGIVTGASR
jgi:two-component system chemotaxis sensor kinase CheA